MSEESNPPTAHNRVNWAVVISMIALALSMLNTYRDKFYYKDSLRINVRPWAGTVNEQSRAQFEVVVVNSGTRDAEIESMYLNITAKISPTNILHDLDDSSDLVLLKPGEIKRMTRNIRYGAMKFDGLADIQLFVNSLDGSGRNHFAVIHIGRAQAGVGVFPEIPGRVLFLKWPRIELDLFSDVKDNPELQPADTGPISK